jgi:hypothetical protein
MARDITAYAPPRFRAEAEAQLGASAPLSQDQLMELERLASIGAAIEDERAAEKPDLEYVANSGAKLRYRDMKKLATELWGTEPPKSADELADRFDKWSQENKSKGAA